jgi:benzoylformate decarboxylase
VAAEKQAAGEASRRRLAEVWDNRPMSPFRMMAEIAPTLPPDTIVVNDAVTSAPAVFAALDFDEPGSIYGGRGGALGWGVGGALGVKLANPGRPVVAVAGDGSAMMTVQGLWTAANANIPVVYVICNNAAYRVLKLNMDLYKDLIVGPQAEKSRYMGMDFPVRPDFAGMAQAMGVHGQRIEDPAELAPAMRSALELGKPAVLDVIIDGTV